MSYAFNPTLNDEISFWLRQEERKPGQSMRARWAAFYLLDPPPLYINDPDEYKALRRSLSDEIRCYGYVLSENDSRLNPSDAQP